jgi:hypothetical protein
MATPLDKDNLTAEECEAVSAPVLKCPRCGLVAEGVRCPRCNAVKVEGCGGSCRGCKVGCGGRNRS